MYYPCATVDNPSKSFRLMPSVVELIAEKSFLLCTDIREERLYYLYAFVTEGFMKMNTKSPTLKKK